MRDQPIQIVRSSPGTRTAAVLTQVEAIFFEAAGRSYAPGPEREAFRERWLGRYLDGSQDAVFLALDGRQQVAGYLVGAVENPALQARFADIGYFRKEFADLCAQFPAHLHINLALAYRSTGIGVRLIEAFAAHAAAAGAAGMHVVTGKGMRNVRFYQRCGFSEQGTAVANGREVVFLGRTLAAPG